MSSLLSHHRELTDGVGKCSVPMWCNGLPAGFCDAPAFGEQENGQERYGRWGPGWLSGRWSQHTFTPGYCSGLACHAHGGPKERAALASLGIKSAEGK